MSDTNKAPERITAWVNTDGLTQFEGGTLFPKGVEIEYLREDHAQALIGAAYEAAAKAAFRACQTQEAGYIDENSRLAQRIENELRLEVNKAIRALTTTDTRAVLAARDERVRREERERALAEAADWLESLDGYDPIGGEHPLVTAIRDPRVRRSNDEGESHE